MGRVRPSQYGPGLSIAHIWRPARLSITRPYINTGNGLGGLYMRCTHRFTAQQCESSSPTLMIINDAREQRIPLLETRLSIQSKARKLFRCTIMSMIKTWSVIFSYFQGIEVNLISLEFVSGPINLLCQLFHVHIVNSLKSKNPLQSPCGILESHRH